MTTVKLPEEGASVHIYQNKQKSPYEDWVIQNSEELLTLSPLKLNGTVFIVLFYICSILEFENTFTLNKSQCAKELGISKASVFNAVKSMEDYGIIKKLGKKDFIQYVLNPVYFYKGKALNFSKVFNDYLNL
jgi:predicted DNA-binding transcriptional regulator